MQLHRSGSIPDWEATTPAQRNLWQRWATRTGGLLTPANIVSILGAALVAAGLWCVAANELWAGLGLLAGGRLLDILDGYLAEHTGTKSPFGESLDATLDKLAVFAALVVFVGAGIVPWSFGLLVGLGNGVTALISLVAKSRGRAVHPERAGKLGTALEWGALLGFVLAVTVYTPQVFTWGVYTVAFASIALNGYATLRYAQALHSQPGRGAK